jgi:hypothetical protein
VAYTWAGKQAVFVCLDTALDDSQKANPACSAC